jgi:hypothetical protein
VAETTQDEREPEGSKDEQEPEGSKDEQEPEGSKDEQEQEESKDEQEPEGSKDEQEPEGSKDEQEPEGSKDEQEQEGADDEQEREPKDLPEPEEKSADDLLGQQVVDSHGYTIGKIEALFMHGQDERASWARVKTGLVRKSSAFLPLHDAQADGRQIRVVYEKEHVNEAPEIEPDGNELSDEEADALHGYYGLDRVTGLTKETAEQDIDLSREPRDANPPTMKDPPWAVEKYPLPDMERPEGQEGEGQESSGQEGEDQEPSGQERENSPDEESSPEASSDEESSHEESSSEDSEERSDG